MDNLFIGAPLCEIQIGYNKINLLQRKKRISHNIYNN